jgi:Xaa-Pro aminopeptidase
MRYSKIPTELFKKNRKKVISKMKKNALAIVASNDEMPRNGDQTFPFRQNSDTFYLTGIEQEKTMLILDSEQEDEKKQATLFILKPDKTTEQWEGHKLRKHEAREISGIENIQYTDNFDLAARNLIVEREYIYLNTNEYAKFLSDVPSKNLRLIKELKATYPLHKYERLAPVITQCRLVKEPEEIELHKKACEITNRAFHRVAKFIKAGVYEYEIEAEMTHEFIRNGASGHAYAPIIASGKNSCVLHYVTNDQKLKDGDLVLMDFGAEYANYSADTTRTLPVSGKFTKRQREVYEAVLRVMKKAIKLIRPGATINTVNSKVNEFIEEELVNLKLITKEELKNQDPDNPVRMKYFMHGTSHFMGLDVHDVGGKDVVFEPGMFMSCEPGIYIEDENIGIRLEDDILVTADGQSNLLSEEPIEPDEIEQLMQS